MGKGTLTGITRRLARLRLGGFLAAASAMTVALPASAAELVMFEEAGCPWCIRWHQEVGEAYMHSAEGRRAPLRSVDAHGSRPRDLAFVKGVRATPTFVLVDDGREIGRIVGYPGADFFWGLLAPMMARLPGGGVTGAPASGTPTSVIGCPETGRPVPGVTRAC